MSATQPIADPRQVTDALARAAYLHDRVRIANHDLTGFEVLIASRQGLFAAGRNGTVGRIAWGSFFGIRCHTGSIYAFEACDRTSRSSAMGRIIRFSVCGAQITSASVLVRGLDNNCHQIAIFGEALHVVDTANQQVLIFTLGGEPVGTKPVLHWGGDGTEIADYRHVNSIARIEGRIALLLHNGGREIERPSELAWLDDDWNIVERQVLPGYACHDIVDGADGRTWHCGSRAGELVTNDGVRVKVSPLFTRGLAASSQGFVVGYSQFGDRAVRQSLAGGVLFLDNAFGVRREVLLDAAPTDLILLDHEQQAQDPW